RAIQSAASKAKLSNYKVVSYPSVKDPFSSLLGASKEKIKMWMFDDGLAEYRSYIEQLRTVVRSSGMQTRLPYTVEIRYNRRGLFKSTAFFYIYGVNDNAST